MVDFSVWFAFQLCIVLSSFCLFLFYAYSKPTFRFRSNFQDWSLHGCKNQSVSPLCHWIMHLTFKCQIQGILNEIVARNGNAPNVSLIVYNHGNIENQNFVATDVEYVKFRFLSNLCAVIASFLFFSWHALCFWLHENAKVVSGQEVETLVRRIGMVSYICQRID